jgi:hypothetical protein
MFVDEAKLAHISVNVELSVAGAGGWGHIGLLGQEAHRLEVVGGLHGINRLPLAY